MKFLLGIVLLFSAASALPRSRVDLELQRWRRATEPFSDSYRVSKAMSPREAIAPNRPAHRETPAHYKPSLKQADGCGVENPCPPEAAADGRIVGGEEACPHQFPWLATVRCTSSTSGGGWLCTGSFIFDNWVLTAGHCVYGCLTYDIYAGAHSLDAVGTPGDETLVISVDGLDGFSFQHPDYRPVGGILSYNDIALIPLPEAVPLSDTVSLSCLPSRESEDDTFAGEFATVTGWGKLSDADTEAADTPHYAHDRPIISNLQCHQDLGTIFGITPDFICIDTTGGVGVCNGDSGGPLNMQPAEGEYGPYVQVGVANYVPNMGCESEKPHAFARVTSFLDWIAEVTQMDV